jgi:hypothetical protein
LDDLTDRKYGFSLQQKCFWRPQIEFLEYPITEPAEEMLFRADGNYMIKQPNGIFELVKKDIFLNAPRPS